ncbi:MAG: hypothetical protein A4E69_01829 [Syntrophus sp. PtaB.Bin138]|nr:MAG: hypothetical protein A4E69_01829 [Syntrophus sp. PtaB.Bin138]
MISYGFTKELGLPFEKVREAVAEELKKEGFGILTEIDLQEKFREKLGVEFKRYVILGACSPPNAFKSVQAEENIGLMLPCNVIVYERGGRTVLSVVRPTVAMQMIDNAELKSVAELVEKKLKNVFDAVP